PLRPSKGKRRRAAKAKTIARYRIRDGTSMAAAHVAGAVAAILSVRPELIGKAADVKSLLLDTASDLGREPNCQGRGFLNLSRALDRRASDALALVPPATATATPV